MADATTAWADAARPVLISTAEHYRGYITYNELAGAVQESTGVRTRSQVRTWIGARPAARRRRLPSSR